MRYVVAFATDNNYIQHFCVCLKSLLVNNKEINFEIYLLNEGITEENKENILKTIEGHNVLFKNISINKKLFENLNTGTAHLATSAYYRLAIPNMINADRVLYLDSDIIVTGKIKELFEIDFNDKYVLAIEEVGREYTELIKPILGMSPNAKYLNSGVLVINTKKWISDNILEKCINFARENPDKILYADQDCLNAIINTEWNVLPLRYNLQAGVLNKKVPLNIQNEINNRHIIHFTGAYPFKPWYYVCLNPYKNEYFKYLKMTPFKNYKPKPNYIDFIKFNYVLPTLSILKKYFSPKFIQIRNKK